MVAVQQISKFRTRLRKWTPVSLDEDNYGREGGGVGIGGNQSSSIELLTLDPEFTREQSSSFSSVWKPVWCTGWHTGVLACAASAVVVLLINVSLTIYAATNPEYKMERGIGTLYSGNCETSKTIGIWLHLGINILSTLLLSGSNYTQQCLAAPTRTEINTAHARRWWMDIGVPSVRNLFMIKAERMLLWIAIGMTSVPLHLLYNSAVHTSLSANFYFVVVVTNNHFEPGAYANATEALSPYKGVFPNDTTGEIYWDVMYQADSHNFQLFTSMLEGHNASTPNYEDLTPSQCTKLYSTNLLSSHRTLFLITKNPSNGTHNNTLLGIRVPIFGVCLNSLQSSSRCDNNEVVSKVASGHPWLVSLGEGQEVEVSGCKSEITKEKCKVRFSLGIMIAVIACNLVKACSMIMSVVRSREPTLVTLGDAIDSFLRIPDPTTVGVCFADRRFIENEWRRGWRPGPRHWKQNGAQRWWTSVSKTRWITFNLCFAIGIIFLTVLLQLGIRHDGTAFRTDIKSMWARGFGKINAVSVIRIPFRNITESILLANLPQTILSFLYLTYNSIFTCMLLGHEWSLFGHHHRTLRVTSPRPGQRSTYWLQMHYAYAIPLMTLSALLHWLTSQSLFLARVDASNVFASEELLGTLNAVGYSSIAIIFTLALGVFALMTAAGMGYKQFAAEITTVGSCSAAISAACHAWGAESEGIIGKKVRWGDVEIVPNLRVRHLTFSSEEGVRKPGFGEVYAGTGREME